MITQQTVYTNILFLDSASGGMADAFGDRFEIIDQVLVSTGVNLANRGNRSSGGIAYQVSVQGWIQQPSGQARNDFINTRSDRCALIFEVR